MSDSHVQTTNPCAHFNHHDPTLTGDIIYDVYEQLRVCPVAHSDQFGGFFVVTDYDSVRQIESDVETFSSAQGVFWPRAEGQLLSVALEQDPPEHTEFRRLFNDLLARPRVNDAEPFIRATATALIANMVSRGSGDWVAEVGSRLPVEVIAHLLGLSPETARRLRELSEDAWEGFGEEQNSAAAMIGVLLEEAYSRRSAPQDDYISRIVNAEVFGRPMTDDEIGNWMQGAALAGHETTMNASSNLVLDLATDSQLQERVRDDRSLIAHVVEESLRLRPPVQNFFRVTTKDVELHGTMIPAGAKVMLIYAAANRDPARFPEPTKLDPTRAFTKHLAFGWGIHRCAGTYLAQVELRVMADVLLDHPPFEIDGQVDFGHAAGGGTFMGLKSLPIRFATQP